MPLHRLQCSWTACPIPPGTQKTHRGLLAPSMLKCDTCAGCKPRHKLPQLLLYSWYLWLRCRDISNWITISRALTMRPLAKLTLITNGSGWHCNSLSSTTVTGPPLVMLPPRNTCNQGDAWEQASATKGKWRQYSDNSQAKVNCHCLLFKKKRK